MPIPRGLVINSGNAVGYHIQPAQIESTHGFWEVFGDRETDLATFWLIWIVQERGESWSPLSLEDVNERYKKYYPDWEFNWAKLIEGGWIVVVDGTCYFTGGFIGRCFDARPAACADEGQ